jgi:NAD(P)-dependent dehydrogenase (short-subunit alcohol dehydrogenase family)
MSGALEGKVAIVTGASRGIGEAIAGAMAGAGAQVVLTSRKQDSVDAAAARINASHPGAALARACHAGKPESIAAFWAWLDEEVGCPDVLVNNAAANPYFGPMIGAQWGAWDKTFEVNVKGPFEMSRQLATRLMAAKKPGSIVNITSVFGQTAAPFQGIYGMTKAAVISLTRTLAFEWGGAGIRVNAVAPGLVDTHFAQAIVGNEALAKRFTERAALGRYATPEELAGIVIYLAGDSASFTSGQVFNIDGGYTSA